MTCVSCLAFHDRRLCGARPGEAGLSINEGRTVFRAMYRLKMTVHHASHIMHPLGRTRSSRSSSMTEATHPDRLYGPLDPKVRSPHRQMPLPPLSPSEPPQSSSPPHQAPQSRSSPPPHRSRNHSPATSSTCSDTSHEPGAPSLHVANYAEQTRSSRSTARWTRVRPCRRGLSGIVDRDRRRWRRRMLSARGRRR